MHYSTKPPRINGKVKNHNGQMPPPYNAGIHFLSTPNVSNTGQLQINRKYINNVGNLNEVSVLQYHRTTNMQIKNNNLEMNHYHNLRHQQHQLMMPQYPHNHLHTHLPLHNPMRRKIVKEKTVPMAAISNPPLRNIEIINKKNEELQNQEEANELNNKSKQLPTKTANSQEEKSAESVSLIKHKQVPEKFATSDHNMEYNKEHIKRTEAQQNIEQILNDGKEHSEADQGEETSDKSAKTAREKTPMCLINDLARFNKISFQYRLTSENGPAHCKRFTVTLILGDEEYTAEGLKIKQAQHLAAKEAIEKTKYKHPTPRTNRRTDDTNAAKSNITPTVELNALAMKLGQQTYYIFDPQQMENNTSCRLLHQSFEGNNVLAQQKPNEAVENIINNGKQIQTLHHKPRQFLSKYQNRFTPFQHLTLNNGIPSAYTYFPSSSPCKITLIVGTKEFVGIGRTLQQAKHDAASAALKVLKEQMAKDQSETPCENVEDNDNKSPISLVFEIGIKRSLAVDFKVLREEGPAHMRTFVTACIVGDIVTEGEGTGKKISKKKAAQKMLEELKKLPPITPVASPIKRTKLKTSYKKNCTDQPKEDVERPWHKNKKMSTELDGTNPINKLIEWHQNNKEKEPEYKLISDFAKENSRRRQFVMEVSSNNIVARGVGNSKKLAKQDAAQNFLMALAESNGSVAPAETENTTETTNVSEKHKNIAEAAFVKVNQSKTLVKQDAEQNFFTLEKKTLTVAVAENNTKKTSDIGAANKNSTETNHLEEEVVNNVLPNNTSSLEQATNEKKTTSFTNLNETTAQGTTNNLAKSPNLHMKDQLMYLAKLLGFEVEFSDYPKGNHNEFLTIVMLSTTPPQICHGVGVNANESQEDAAKNALKILSEMGLNNAVKS